MADFSGKTGIVSLITDFGQKDPFVGIMKGVMLSINPELTLVDISHEITPHDVIEAALTLKLSYRYFPEGTVHLVVVDPGVGGERIPLAAEASEYFFVGPDNGVLAPVLEETNAQKKIVSPTEERYFRPEVSQTFHGRDIFGPVAAWLTRGVALAELGYEIFNYQKLSIPRSGLNKDGDLEGEVIFNDQFGNLITNILKSDLDEFAVRRGRSSGITKWQVSIGPYRILGLKSSYDQGSGQDLSALVNSFNCLEIFLFQASAWKFTQLQPHERVVVTF